MTNAATRSRNAASNEDEETPATSNAEASSEEKKEKDVVSIAFQVPVAFKTKLEAYADEHKVTIAKMARAELARLVDFDVTPFETQTRTRASKYASDEEREAARKAKSKERSDTIKLLMEKLKKGEITL